METLTDILIAIQGIQEILFETNEELKNSKDSEKIDFLDLFKITCEKTIINLVKDAQKLGHFCDVCQVVIIDNNKQKKSCYTCDIDLSECLKTTNMNLEQFKKRQLERIEIFKNHSPNQIQLMQKKENES